MNEQCKGLTRSGERCKIKAGLVDGYCRLHRRKSTETEEDTGNKASYNDYKKEDLYLIGDPLRVLINWFEGRSTEVKGKVAKAITDGVTGVAGADITPENVTVSFSDAKISDFFKAGKSLK